MHKWKSTKRDSLKSVKKLYVTVNSGLRLPINLTQRNLNIR